MFHSLRHALTIVRSGVVDREYYEALTGRRFGNSLAVVRHYLAADTSAGWSLHPLFEPTHLERKPQGEEDIFLRYLSQPKLFRKQSPHPVFDLAAAKRLLREAGAPFPDGAWLTWARAATPRTPVPVSDDSTPVLWGDLRGELLEAASAWRTGSDKPKAAGVARTVVPGRTSVIVVMDDSLAAGLRRLDVLRGEGDRELVCSGFTSRPQLSCFSALAATRPIVVVRDSDANVAEQWNGGAAASSGDSLVFVAPNATLKGSDVTALLAGLDANVALTQPLNEHPDMTIRSAGAYFPPDDVVPSPLLDHHPTADVETLGITPIPAIESGVLAIRRVDYEAVGGFDNGFANDLAEVDLSLRATAAGLGRAALVPTARATVRPRNTRRFPNTTDASAQLLRKHHQLPPDSDSAAWLHRLGFEVVGHHSQLLAASSSTHSGLHQLGQPNTATSAKVPELARLHSGVSALPRLRWTIDTPVTAGWWAQIWGDWHFATSLARALRRLGQDVAVDTRQARGRETRRLDDVLLTLRGTEAVAPTSAPVNLLWVLYSADEVTPEELVGYDRVFAASNTWAAERAREWAIDIEPLLQCTDPDFFNPGRAVGQRNDRALFVGNTRRGVARPIVEAALAGGIEVDLYGTGWEVFPSANGKVRARKVSNDELGRLYAEAGVVLNDHREDMSRSGFISNRLFDAVACGARVLSDPIPGADELFGGCVQICSPEAVGDRLRAPWDDHWPIAEQRLAVAARVREEHSFDRRAQVLLERAVSTLRANQVAHAPRT